MYSFCRRFLIKILDIYYALQLLFRPHRGLSVMTVSPAKMAELSELIKVPFGIWTLVGSRNSTGWGRQIPHGKGHFRGG